MLTEKTASAAAPSASLGAVSFDDAEREPVVGAALGERHAEHDDAERVGARLAPRRHGERQPLAPARLAGRRVAGPSSISRARDVRDADEGDDDDERPP